MNPYRPKQLADSMRTVCKNTIQIAETEDIPEKDYGYRPNPDSRSVSETLVHMAFLGRADYVRGDAREKLPLQFVRFEPYVLPKKSLTGDATERVDTRVLKAIYSITDENAPVYVGQRMDVDIETPLSLKQNQSSGSSHTSPKPGRGRKP